MFFFLRYGHFVVKAPPPFPWNGSVLTALVNPLFRFLRGENLPISFPPHHDMFELILLFLFLELATSTDGVMS